jgi:hypothetical protein
MTIVSRKSITRAEWDKLNPWDQRKKFNEGFRPVDVPAAIKTYPPEARMIDRSEWDTLTPYEQAAKIREGFKPVD